MSDTAIAVELRAQADKLEATAGGLSAKDCVDAMRYAVGQLRERADELDPPRPTTIAEAIQHAVGLGTKSRTRPCPDCAKPILVTDNGVWLEEATEGRMALMAPQQMGPLLMAVGMGDPAQNTHDIHEHQPDDT